MGLSRRGRGFERDAKVWVRQMGVCQPKRHRAAQGMGIPWAAFFCLSKGVAVDRNTDEND
jgi:hypothetical protein